MGGFPVAVRSEFLEINVNEVVIPISFSDSHAHQFFHSVTTAGWTGKKLNVIRAQPFGQWSGQDDLSTDLNFVDWAWFRCQHARAKRDGLTFAENMNHVLHEWMLGPLMQDEISEPQCNSSGCFGVSVHWRHSFEVALFGKVTIIASRRNLYGKHALYLSVNDKVRLYR
ncbi:MAG: hypothetical protein AAB480_00930 [Patescibacteria group bacterium]